MRQNAGLIGICFRLTDKPLTVMERSIGNIGIVEAGSWSKSVGSGLSDLNRTEAGGLVQNV